MTTTHHEETLADRAAMLAMRGLIALQPKMALAPEGRPAGDELLAKTPAFNGVGYEPAVVGDVSGWWCRPAGGDNASVILFLHGGAYVLGSAAAYRNFVGQIAGRSGIAAFVADYALAPERPFPAAFNDALAVYRGLVEEGYDRIVIAGDSAGGGLALALLAAVSGQQSSLPRPQAAVVMSPWIDLALGGDSIVARASHDPLLTREGLAGAAALYLGGHDPHDPRVSALDATTADLPPVQLHVGTDEILLDDAVRYSAAVEHAGGTTELHVWKGMVHVFPANVALLAAAGTALDLIGAFIRTHAGS